MGSSFWSENSAAWLYLSVLSFAFVSANCTSNNNTTRGGGGGKLNGRIEGTVFIDGKAYIGEIDEDFICATLDWWPPEKCDYGTCAWDRASFLNLDLDNKILYNAVKAFSPLKLRLGGTLQDKVIYESKDNSSSPCTQFVHNATEMFGFTQGCLPMRRWDELNAFFNKTGVVVVFGLNALAGRNLQKDGSSVGAWDPTNAASLITYTVEKGYTVHGWELGNELSGDGVGTRVSADQYAADVVTLKKLLEIIYKNKKHKPLLVAPGGFFHAAWFSEFINKTPGVVDVATHHIYNLGPGVDNHLIDKILDPSYLDGEADTFRSLKGIIQKNPGSSAVAWVGEAGGAYNSGRNHVTNAFVFSFWYLDQLGMSASYDTKSYCRQTLIGGNYGLLNTTTYVPNPDYYSALLWHRLMGGKVLSTSFSGSNKLRAYAHCAKQSSGITLLLINLDGNTTIEAKVAFNSSTTAQFSYQKLGPRKMSRSRAAKKFYYLHKYHSYSKVEAEKMTREEYHLTAKDGDLQSQTMMLNEKMLVLNSSGEIPALNPVNVNSSEPISVGPFSIVFVHIPYVVLPACKKN